VYHEQYGKEEMVKVKLTVLNEAPRHETYGGLDI
jgi:hypothetical protein